MLKIHFAHEMLSEALQIKSVNVCILQYLTVGLADLTLSTGSQTEDDLMQSTSSGENSCSLLSKTVVLLLLYSKKPNCAS